MTSSTTTTTQPTHQNILIIGGGLAGLSSAIESISHATKINSSIHITLLDKEKSLGGNSAKATSGMNSILTNHQLDQNIIDSIAAFENDTLKSGGELSDPALVKLLVQNAKEALEWVESFGITLDNISQCGGHSHPRTHRETPKGGKPAPVGWDIIKTLKSHIETNLLGAPGTPGKITIITNANVTKLLSRNKPDGFTEVYGIVYTDTVSKETTLLGDAVILTTGGYAHGYNSHLPEKFRHLPTTNGPWATGDAISLVESLGAWVVDLDQVQVHPTGFVNPSDPGNKSKFLAPEALRGYGGILLNPFTGKRFVNELGTRDVVSKAIFDTCVHENVTAKPKDLTSFKLLPSTAYLVLTGEGVQMFDPTVIGFYTSKGFFFKFGNVDELSEFIGVDSGVLRNEFDLHNTAKRESKSDQFGKTVFTTDFLPDSELYLCIITPSIHYTMGGIRINAACEVLKPPSTELEKQIMSHETFLRGEPILNLFAAGEASGGLHGKNRLAGNSLLECVVFGRVAARKAVGSCSLCSVLNSSGKQYLPALSKDEFVPLRFREKIPLGNHTVLLRFDLPSQHCVMGTGVGGYISIRANVNGEELVRYYSPVNRPDQPGLLDLLIKVDDNGKMSNYLGGLRMGDVVEFKGPLGGVELGIVPGENVNSAKKIRKIGLICGGTGISPMIQIIRSVFFHNRTDISMKLMYGAMDESELVYKDLLLSRERETDGWLKTFFTLDKPSQEWKGSTGFIDAEKVKSFMFPPADDVKIVVCGPYKMCQVVKKMLEEVGYTKDMVFSYM